MITAFRHMSGILTLGCRKQGLLFAAVYMATTGYIPVNPIACCLAVGAVYHHYAAEIHFFSEGSLCHSHMNALVPLLIC